MRRVELLIDAARKLSQNTRYDETSGVPQDVFVQFLNNAQDSLTMQVQNLKTKYFKEQVIVDVVPGQEVYDYPDHCYLQNLDTIQWTDSRTGTYWQTLYKSVTKEKVTIQPGYPFAYIPYHDGFHLNPPIINGQLYITFVKTPLRLQKRAGQITVATIVGDNLTALTVNPALSDYDPTEINFQNYLCVVDKFGRVKASNILYDSVAVATGVFTLSPFDLEGATIAVGDYILIGENMVNLPEWGTICEGYLIKHMVYEAKYGDSSAWTKEARDDMNAYFGLLSSSFAQLTDDITDIPVTNLDYVGW
jgi:hypothetical protein